MANVAIGNLYRDTADRLMLRAVTAPPGVGLGWPCREGHRLIARIAGTDGILRARPYRDAGHRLRWRMAGEGQPCVYISDLECIGPLQAWGLARVYAITATAAGASGYQGVWSLAYEPELTHYDADTRCFWRFWRATDSGRTVWLTMRQIAVPSVASTQEHPAPVWVGSPLQWTIHLGGTLSNGLISGSDEVYVALTGSPGLYASPVHLWYRRAGDESELAGNLYSYPGRVFVSGPSPDGCATPPCYPVALTVTVSGLGRLGETDYGVLNGTHQMYPYRIDRGAGVSTEEQLGYASNTSPLRVFLVREYDPCSQDQAVNWRAGVFTWFANQLMTARANPPAGSCGAFGWPTGVYADNSVRPGCAPRAWPTARYVVTAIWPTEPPA